jgi:site-specific recombinase XerD
MSILYWLRRNYTNRNGENMIWCTLHIESAKAEFGTKLQCKPGDWNHASQQAMGKYCDAINNQLEQITHRLLEIKITLQAQNKPVTAQKVKSIYQTKTELAPTFLICYKNMLALKKTNEKTRSKYEAIYQHFIEFLEQDRLSALFPEDVTEGTIDEYRHFLEQKGVHSQGHMYRCVSHIKNTLSYCHKRKMQVDESAMNYEISKGKPKPIVYLTSNQFETLQTFCSPNNYLQKTRDLAIFQRFTGFAYVDLMDFDYKQDVLIENGRQWIKKNREKSDVQTLLPLFPEALAILEKYDYCLPKISNQKYNAYLGTIGELIGLPFKLTSHILRKTAGMLWLQQGTPYEIVSRMLGHSNIQTTQRHYVQVDFETMCKHFSKP